MFVTNRSAGKTTSLHRYFLKNALFENEQFVVLFRRKQDLPKSSIQFSGALELFKEFKDVCSIVDKPTAGKCVREYIATVQKEVDGQIEISQIKIGYAVSLFDADDVKKYSALFSKVKRGCMDEFQIESGKYLKDELTKFQSVYNSIARGGGEQSRNVEMFLLSNDISMINPYYIYYGIPKRLKPDTKKLRGNGWVLIREHNADAEIALKTNTVNRSFENSAYQEYSSGDKQLVSVTSFIERLSGKSKYLFTVCYDKKKYGFRLSTENGYLHVSTKCDPTSIINYVLRDVDIKEGYFLLRKNSDIWKNLKKYYDKNSIRFENEECKNLIFDILGIDILN